MSESPNYNQIDRLTYRQASTSIKDREPIKENISSIKSEDYQKWKISSRLSKLFNWDYPHLPPII